MKLLRPCGDVFTRDICWRQTQVLACSQFCKVEAAGQRRAFHFSRFQDSPRLAKSFSPSHGRYLRHCRKFESCILATSRSHFVRELSSTSHPRRTASRPTIQLASPARIESNSTGPRSAAGERDGRPSPTPRRAAPAKIRTGASHPEIQDYGRFRR